MKLLILEPDPSFGGGSEAVTLSLARELAGLGHQVILLHESDGSMLADYGAFATDIIRQPLPGFALRSPWRTLACVLRIGRLARQLGVDAIVSSHLGFIRHSALVRLWFGIRSCFHLGLSLDHAGSTLRLAAAHAGDGVAPSAHTLDSWRAGGWDRRALHLVSNWVDAARFQPVADRLSLRRELGLPEQAPLIVFVGRVCRQKGVDVLLRAFPGVLARCAEARLELVGPVSADFEPQLQATLAGLDESTRARIEFRPVTANPEKFYAAADVVCAPSVGDEAFGLTVLEAMACGVPVVTSSIGVIPEILGGEHAGLLAPPNDVAALAQRLASWLERPADRAACGASLRLRAVRGYGPDASIARYEAILLGLPAAGSV